MHLLQPREAAPHTTSRHTIVAMNSQRWSLAGNPRKPLGKTFLAATALAWYLSSEDEDTKAAPIAIERSVSSNTSTEVKRASEEDVISTPTPTFLGRPLSTFHPDRSTSSLSRYYSTQRTRITPRAPTSRPLAITGRTSYSNEFLELGKLGSGAYGSVFRSQNVLDGNIYAIKKVTLPLKLPAQRQIDDFDQYPPPDELIRLLREPQTMATVGYHRNLVRYHHAWIEVLPTQKDDVEADEIQPMSLTPSGNSSRGSSSHCDQVTHEKSEDDWNDSYSDGDSTEGGDVTNDQSPPSTTDRSLVLFIQMELCSGASLYDWLRLPNRKVNVSENQRLFKQLIQGIAHLHSKGYCHRDVKPANLLIVPKNGDNKLKVGDFGCCKRMEESDGSEFDSKDLHPSFASSVSSHSDESSQSTSSTDLTEGCGTFFYMAPELHTPRYNLKVDIFAAGIVLFELYQVFSTEMERHCLITQLHEKRLVPRSFMALYPDVARLVLKLTHSDPEQRPSAYDLLNDSRYGLCPVQDLDPFDGM